jgi:hypothetical protein
MTYETFLKITLTLQKADRELHELSKRRVDLLDFVDPYHDIIALLIREVYGEEGADWYSWFCYENDFGHKGMGAWDENKNPICYSFESTWEYLEKNYNKNAN